MPDRRTVGELLAHSEALASETLLDATLAQAPAMVRSWNQLVESAAELWAVLPSASNRSPSWSDSMERVRAIGETISRTVTARHLPGQGPTDEQLTQIADNLSRAQHLVERPGRTSPPASQELQPDIEAVPGQVMHMLYVAAHGTAVALNAYVRDLKDRSEIGKPRRQPMTDRPTAGDHRSTGHDRTVRWIRTARGGVPLRAATHLGKPRPGDTGGTGHTAGVSLGRLGDSGAPHPGR